MLIREIKESDNAALATMIREIFIEHGAPTAGTVYSDPTTDNLFELFKQPKSVLWVAETEDGIAGCSGIFPTEGLPEHCAELVKVYVSQQARGTGIGKILMQKSIASAVELGYTQLYLESISAFSKAVSIYEKLGFYNLEQPYINSVHNGCNIWMLKDLD